MAKTFSFSLNEGIHLSHQNMSIKKRKSCKSISQQEPSAVVGPRDQDASGTEVCSEGMGTDCKLVKSFWCRIK